MKSYEARGKTLDLAIQKAVEELGVNSKDDLEIRVIQESTKGLLGLGAKEAKILATVISPVVETTTNTLRSSEKPCNDNSVVSSGNNGNVEKLAVEFLKDVTTKMGVVDPQFEVSKDGQSLLINVVGENTSVLIGKRGVTLDAIQTLVNFAANKGLEDYINIRLDTENYREARIKSLEKLATNLALKVKKTKKSATLEPMSSYERRIIHAALQDDSEVETHSEGQGSYRHVIIKYVGR